MNPQEELTPAQALELLYRVTGTIQLNRADHQMVEKAIQVLAVVVKDATEKTAVVEKVVAPTLTAE